MSATNSDAPTVATAVFPGSGHVYLSKPVPAPCRIRLSPHSPWSGEAPVYKCVGETPYKALLGYGDPHSARVALTYAHAAGALVRVAVDDAPGHGDGRPAGLMLRQSVSLAPEVSAADSEYCGFVFSHPRQADQRLKAESAVQAVADWGGS